MTTSSLCYYKGFLVVRLGSFSNEDEKQQSQPSSIEQNKCFTDFEEFRTFLMEENSAKIRLIVSESFVDHLVELDDFPQICSIYVLSERTNINLGTIKKLQGIYPLMATILRMIGDEFYQQHPQSNPIVFSSSTNVLNPSLMYSQLLKEILFEGDLNGNEKDELIKYWRHLFSGDASRLKIIDEFQREYHHHTPIWWYTKGTFIYEFLNAALRTMNIDQLLRMSFFLRDIHQQIEQLYQSQTSSSRPLIVYRGQRLSWSDFHRLHSNQNGLISFENFLSTSQTRQVALMFCPDTSTSDFASVLFEIHLDPNQNTTPYASLNSISYYSDSEAEILFSIHSVFRIESIVEEQENLWKIQLRTTTDQDEDLQRLTTYLREHIDGSTGPIRLANLSVHLEDFDRAEEIFRNLLANHHEENSSTLALIYNQLGFIAQKKGELNEAQEFFEKSFEITKKFHRSDKIQWAVINNNLGRLYSKQGKHSKAFSKLSKALTLIEFIPFSQSHIVISIYSNLAEFYRNQNDHRRVLYCLEKICRNQSLTLPNNHPDIALTYNQIASTYIQLKNYKNAFDYLRRARTIQEKSLLPNHSNFVQTYNNFGLYYHHQDEYHAALIFYQKALQIAIESSSKNPFDIASIYRNIASIYVVNEEYSLALEIYDEVLKLCDSWASWSVYDSIGDVYRKQKNYSKALEYYQKALEGRQNSSNILKSELIESYDHFGRLFYERDMYSEALEYYRKSCHLQEEIYFNQPWQLVRIYQNFTVVLIKMTKYSDALIYLEKIRLIQEESLATCNPDLLETYKRIAYAYFHMKDYSKTLLAYEKALKHAQSSNDCEDLKERIEQVHSCIHESIVCDFEKKETEG